MKKIKELKNTIESDKAKCVILFDDGTTFSHTVTPEELSKIQDGDRMYIENLIAKYKYRDAHAFVNVWRYVNSNKEICASPCGFSCGQCKFFRQTGVSYNELIIGVSMPNSWPYPVGVCEKHGFGPRLSAFHTADGDGCGWEIADWCKLNDKELTEVQKKELFELWK